MRRSPLAFPRCGGGVDDPRNGVAPARLGALDRQIQPGPSHSNDPRRGEPPVTEPTAELQTVLRRNAEQQYAEELAALAAEDDHPRPSSWHLSPWAVRTYLTGGKTKKGVPITPKYIGNVRLIEIAVATLATDRALL